MRKVRFRCLGERHVLRDEIFFRSGLAVIVWPAIHGRDFARPVTVLRVTWRSPLQRIRVPWVGRSQLAAEHAVEEIEQEDPPEAEKIIEEAVNGKQKNRVHKKNSEESRGEV